MLICPNPVKLSRLFFGMIVTINSLISVTLAHANTEFFFIAPANPTSAKTAQSHHMPIGLHHISQTVSYRIHMLPNIQKQRNPMMVVSHDKENDALPSANEILEMDKVEACCLLPNKNRFNGRLTLDCKICCPMWTTPKQSCTLYPPSVTTDVS